LKSFEVLKSVGFSLYMKSHGVFWSLMKSHEVSWSPLKSSEVSWSPLKSLEVSWSHLKSREVCWSPLKSFEVFRNLLKIWSPSCWSLVKSWSLEVRCFPLASVLYLAIESCEDLIMIVLVSDAHQII
jgi:hypothetical protein